MGKLRCNHKLALLLLLLIKFNAFSQFSTKGNDFFVPIIDLDYTEIIIRTEVLSSVTIEDLFTGIIQNVTIPANSNYAINASSYGLSPLNLDLLSIQKSLHINSDEPISVYYDNSEGGAGGTSIILPQNSLGSNYSLVSDKIEKFSTSSFNPKVPYFVIIATEDNSEINLNLTHDSDNGYFAGSTFSIALNKGESYLLRGIKCQAQAGQYPSCSDVVSESRNDFSGTHIWSSGCKNFSVFLYYESAPFSWGDQVASCCSDQRIENYLPNKSWGTNFWLLPEPHVTHGNVFKVFAQHDSTFVYLNNSLIDTLQKNETLDTLLYAPSYLVTSKKTSVMQNSISAHFEGPWLNATDPEMLFVYPNVYQTSNCIVDLSVTTSYALAEERSLILVTANNNLNNILIDGVSVPANQFFAIPGDVDNSYTYQSLTPTLHSINATNGSYQAIVFVGHSNGVSSSFYSEIESIKNSLTQQLEPDSSAVSLCLGSGVDLAPSNEEVGYNLSWSNGDSIPEINVSEVGVYTVEFSNCDEVFYESFEVIDCSSSVDCGNDVFVPNVITPNADGVNDVLTFKLSDCFSFLSFEVVNRWGDIVFKTLDNNTFWEGEFLGEPLSESAYFWILKYREVSGKEQEQTGYVTLIR
ncbi:MAG: gliding motility-associated C-terminal domain-containing protein [Crocinitomicaceae bacterium]|nr:gliding motility-associated C-terminal domain-containing protein [Crocinitomicaceae bacterium]